MSSISREGDQVFILRCWREVGNDLSDAEWRVQVSVIDERRRYVLEGLEDAFDFIRRKLRGTKLA